MSSLRERLSAVVSGSVAEHVAEEYGSLRSLFTASESELLSRGVPRGAAKRLTAVAELAREWGTERISPGARFWRGEDIFKHYHLRLRDLQKEQFWAVLLDGKNRIRKEVRISEGTLTAALVHPREVFAPAIRASAAAIVFVHNHPSGDPTPSVEDVEITQRLCSVADLVGIRVLDHVVIGDGAYVSSLERGLIAGAAPKP